MFAPYHPTARTARPEASNNAIWVVSKSLTADVVAEAGPRLGVGGPPDPDVDR